MMTIKQLRDERRRLEADITMLREEVAALEADRSAGLTLRCIHQDVDSIKHILRTRLVAQGGIDAFLTPDIPAVLKDIRANYADAQKPQPAKQTRRSARKKKK